MKQAMPARNDVGLPNGIERLDPLLQALLEATSSSRPIREACMMPDTNERNELRHDPVG
ncbi:hypothetical protein [Bradyrhizobium sp. SZCCHNRI3037]|uniref:hypothetical protein n=1 Tax=Bradyrhizobium sp. SZCCHNRI3037 TaxID=3057290 RepID=UPI002915F3C2|nr:hypothetical protein [Bradyrhizobium sp. SZCCHNRI3037]